MKIEGISEEEKKMLRAAWHMFESVMATTSGITMEILDLGGKVYDATHTEQVGQLPGRLAK